MTASHSASVMFVEHPVAEDAGVVDETSRPPKVSTAWSIRRLAPSKSEHVVAVGDGLAAHGLDLGDDVVRRAGALARCRPSRHRGR